MPVAGVVLVGGKSGFPGTKAGHLYFRAVSTSGSNLGGFSCEPVFVAKGSEVFPKELSGTAGSLVGFVLGELDGSFSTGDSL